MRWFVLVIGLAASGVASAEELVQVEAEIIKICMGVGQPLADRLDQLDFEGFSFELPQAKRMKAVLALGAALTPTRVEAATGGSLGAAYVRALQELQVKANAADNRHWREGGSVTGRSFLLLEASQEIVSCTIALGRPAGAADIAAVLGREGTTTTIPGGTLTTFDHPDLGTVLNLVEPDIAALTAAGVSGPRSLIFTKPAAAP